MIHVEVEIEIMQSPEVVFEYISDFTKNTEWQSGMKESYMLTEGPLAVGSRYAQVASFLGKKIESVFEVTAFEPGKMVNASSVKSAFPISFSRSVEPSGVGTLVKTKVEGDPGSYFKIGGFMLRKMVESTIRKDYKKLRKRLSG